MDCRGKTLILPFVAGMMTMLQVRVAGTLVPSFSSRGWRIEKHTINVHSSTGVDVNNFISKYLCTPKGGVPSDLGCGNLRDWCQIASPYSAVEWPGYTFELHWVDAPTLNDFSDATGKRDTDAWIEYFEGLQGKHLDFTAFSHNKIQLYVQDLAPYIKRFDKGNVTYFARLSNDKSGAKVGHVGVSISGVIYELVGAAVDHEGKWRYWSEDECPGSHTLVESLSFYAEAAKRAYPKTLGHGFGEMLIAGISMSFHDPLAHEHTSSDKSIHTLYTHLSAIAGAEVSKHREVTKSCAMSEIIFESMPGLVTRYVNNESPNLKPLQKHRSVADYDDYAASLHAHYSQAKATKYSGEWYGWDHMLDQHLGLWYGGDTEDCLKLANVSRRLLQESHLGVGERGEPDAHEMYVGYAGPMTWEYQWQNCDAGRPAAPSECACIASNNIDEYKASSNQTSCSKPHLRAQPTLV